MIDTSKIDHFIKKYIFLIAIVVFGSVVIQHFLSPALGEDYYHIGFNCGTVVGKKKASAYKNQPSVLVKNNDNGQVFEVIRYYTYLYDFNQINIGDRVFKNKDDWNMLLIKQNGTQDTVVFDVYDWVANSKGVPRKKIDFSKVNMDCY